MAKTLTDSELVNICVSEIRSAGSIGSDLDDERAQSLDYYLGEPYGDEVEGRSQIRTREVLDTVESILPSLARIFCDAENMVEFDPVSEDDEEKAQQESDRVSHEYWKNNRGFYNTYVFLKDALLSKTGTLKCWWSEHEEEEREEYKGLSAIELAQLMNEEGVEREVLEHEFSEDLVPNPQTGQYEQTIDVTFATTQKGGRLEIEPVTPEEFGVSRDARTPYAQDCQFVYHRVKKTRSELVEEGYDDDQIDKIPHDDDDYSQEHYARRHLSDETDEYGTHEALRPYWVTECYVKADRDGDGIAEMLKVTLATGAHNASGASSLLDVEEVDANPFFTASPVLLTHKFYGLSIADLVMDLQRIKSTLVRQILDNTYLANNSRTAINDRVNLEDMLTSRPGGVARVKGREPIDGSIMPIVNTPLPSEAFGLLEYLDELRKDRTGSGDQVAGLDAKSLANVNSSVAAIAYDQARARIELIARILGEVGFRPLFKRIHELLQKNQSKAEAIKLRGKWIEINPSEWRTRKNISVAVGLGVSSRERRLISLDTIAQRQETIVAAGGMGTLVMPDHLYNQLHDQAEAMGLEPSRYYQDPRDLPPQGEDEPSVQDEAMLASAQAQLQMAQAQNDKNKVDAQKVQVEAMKAQSDERIRVAEVQQKQLEMNARVEVQRLTTDLGILKAESEQGSKNSKTMMDAEIKAREQELKAAELRLKDAQENTKREVDVYKALLAAGTTLTAEQMKMVNPQMEQEPDKNAELIKHIWNELGEMKAMIADENSKPPKLVKRDPETGLIISIGDSPINRDASGRVESIG